MSDGYEGERIMTYKHVVQYYETDRMQVTHHSNYIRFMEEARSDFLRRIGWGYERFEEEGIISPVTHVECDFKKTTTYADVIEVEIYVEEMRGVRMKLRYVMRIGQDVVCEARSEHCFLDRDGRLVNVKKRMPQFCEELQKHMSDDQL